MDQHIVEEIKANLDIVDLLSGYVELKRAGKNYKALCPFHAEKTPSFIVSPEKQIFHCFGCGAGGDVFTFLQRYEGLSFPEAVRALAERAGVKITRDSFSASGPGRLRKTLIGIHRDALTFYREALGRERRATEYLKRRGLSEEMIERFEIGFAPFGGGLLDFLRKKGYSDAHILTAGLCKETSGGKVDAFRGRVIFPIINVRGEVIAFGARSIGDDARGPKYLNSPETPIFKKSSELFGINLAKGEIRKKGYALLMEGYLDVITAHQYGIENAVAPLGTALTEGQAKRLKPLTEKLLLVFDSDSSGVRASKRALSMLYEKGFIARVLSLPEGDDPDTFLRREGREAFVGMFREVKGLVDFYLEHGGERVDTARELIYIISKVKDGILRSDLIRELSEKTGLSEQFLREELLLLRRETGPPMGAMQGGAPRLSAEMLLLGLYITYPEYAPVVKEGISPEDIEDERVRRIFEKLYSSSAASLKELTSGLEEQEMSVVSGSTIGLEIDAEEVVRNIKDCIRSIRSRRLRKRLKDLELEIRLAEKRGQSETVSELQGRMNILIKEGVDEGIL